LTVTTVADREGLDGHQGDHHVTAAMIRTLRAI
jgi:hypothetical protein